MLKKYHRCKQMGVITNIYSFLIPRANWKFEFCSFLRLNKSVFLFVFLCGDAEGDLDLDLDIDRRNCGTD